MKKLIILFSILLIETLGCAQTLAIDSISKVPSICRVVTFQAGRGSLSVHASGGTTPYTYLWEKIGTTQNFTNQTWTNLNPGTFKITVTDNVGAMVTDTVQLDSINPTASFSVVSSALTPSGNDFAGTVPAYVEFINQSYNMTNANHLDHDTIFIWRLSQAASYFFSLDISEIIDTTYATTGTWEVSLSTRNSNDCADTARTFITLGNLGVEGVSSEDFYLAPIGQSQIKIGAINNVNGEIIRVFTLTGAQVYEGTLQSNESIIHLAAEKQMYIYEILNASGSGILSKGKFLLR